MLLHCLLSLFDFCLYLKLTKCEPKNAVESTMSESLCFWTADVCTHYYGQVVCVEGHPECCRHPLEKDQFFICAVSVVRFAHVIFVILGRSSSLVPLTVMSALWPFPG